jgi:hypothetical protein
LSKLEFVRIIAKQALKALATKIPGLSFLFVGPLGPLSAFFLEKLLTFLVERTALGASIILVTLETDSEKRAYEAAITAALEASKSKHALTKEQEDHLEQNIINATREFIHLRRVRERDNS